MNTQIGKNDMKRLLLASLILILLTSCRSKRDICASWAANQINHEEAARKLGINIDTENYSQKRGRIIAFCEYYRN